MLRMIMRMMLRTDCMMLRTMVYAGSAAIDARHWPALAGWRRVRASPQRRGGAPPRRFNAADTP